MELRLYDTLTREKRAFAPIDANNVRMYVCGPTVYDFAHIGNARPVIVFDVLFRLLRHVYGADHVTYVRNITDVDDKINARALRDHPGLPLNDAIRKVTEATESQFQADAYALGCLAPTFQPRATDFVLPRSDGRADMKSLIQELLDRRNAYVAIGSEGREVLFDVSSMPDYGALSKRRLDEQMPGARVAVDSHKKNAEDFVLWKESGAKEPGWKGEFRPNPRSGYDAEFTISPENASRLQLNSQVVAIHGRPGWHIECSAMSAAYLGKTFDIHGGGLDLIFPHHENEIAQSRCAHGTPTMANYWMHNGFLEVEGQKMSKSLGNFVTIRELLNRDPNNSRWGEVLRFNMLRTHYRQPIDWTAAGLSESMMSYEDLRQVAVRANKDKMKPSAAVLKALADDLNTSAVITELYRLAAEARSTSPGSPLDAANELAGSLQLLGFDKAIDLVRSDDLRGDLERAFQVDKAREKGLDPTHLDNLVERRAIARARKDFKESDRIRDELAAMGVAIKDSKEGTTWEIAR
jgi:cysteinyl-tRNA synthetase